MQPPLTTEQNMERTLLVLKVVWLALLGSLGAYVFVGRWVAPGLPARLNAETFRILRTGLYALSLVVLAAAGFVRRRVLAAKNPPAGPAQKYASAVITSLAMSESVGIYGLFLFLLGRDASDLYLLVALSAATMVYFRPRREELLSLAQR